MDIRQTLLDEEAGIKILGSISGSGREGGSMPKSGGVVLVKVVETAKIHALRKGFDLKIKDISYTVKHIEKEFIVIAKKRSRQLIRVVREGFAGKSSPKKKQKKLKRQPGIYDSFRENGFERDKGEIKVTKAYRDAMIKGQLGKILMQASATPFITKNGVEGFEIDQIEPGSIFEKAGLANGDIVTSINNIPLKSVTAAVKLLQSLKNSTRMDLVLKRKGVEIPVSIEVQ